MTTLGVIGPIQIVLILIIPIIVVFFIGYKIGQKSGYSQRVKEQNKR